MIFKRKTVKREEYPKGLEDFVEEVITTLQKYNGDVEKTTKELKGVTTNTVQDIKNRYY